MTMENEYEVPKGIEPNPRGLPDEGEIEIHGMCFAFGPDGPTPALVHTEVDGGPRDYFLIFSSPEMLVAFYEYLGIAFREIKIIGHAGEFLDLISRCPLTGLSVVADAHLLPDGRVSYQELHTPIRIDA